MAQIAGVTMLAAMRSLVSLELNNDEIINTSKQALDRVRESSF